MTIKQVSTILNSIQSQITGAAAVGSLDITDLISLGKSSIASDDYKDKWIGQLVDRIGKTVLRTLKVNVLYPELLRHEYEFGAMIQKIDIQPFDAVDNDEWKIGDNGYTPNQFAVAKPNVTQTFFTDANTFKFKVTVPDTQLKTAFTSAEAMASFMGAVADTLETSMVMAVNNMNRTAVNNFIAEKIHAANGVVDLLNANAGGYNATLPNADRFTSYEAAVIDPGFQKFASLKIKSFIKYLSEPSTIYNVGNGKTRATSPDEAHILLTTDFISAADVMLNSNVFHEELTKLTGFSEVKSWQGTSATANALPDVTSNSTINVTTSSGATVEQTGIVGAIADKNAIFTGLLDRYMASDRNNADRYTNVNSGCTGQWCNDLTENGVVFIATV